MQPSFSGLFVTCAYLPAESEKKRKKRRSARRKRTISKEKEKKGQTPNDLSCAGNKTEIADVDLDDGSLCDDAELCVKRRLRIFLDAQDIEVKRCLEFGTLFEGWCKVKKEIEREREVKKERGGDAN